MRAVHRHQQLLPHVHASLCRIVDHQLTKVHPTTQIECHVVMHNPPDVPCEPRIAVIRAHGERQPVRQVHQALVTPGPTVRLGLEPAVDAAA